mgnify:CR=1 FL=1|tara:strand:+ start:123962 stop:124987 length:1026 start_codon:yes stop_codon:yes gene_type:complete
MAANMNFLDLSGYMFSGKSAVADVISEIEGYYSFGYLKEFDLLRVPGGVLDLYDSVNNWSYIGVDAALRRFISLTTELGRRPRGLQRLYLNGWDYDSRYPGFNRATQDFLESLIEVEWNSSWPYAELGLHPVDVLFKKIRSKLIKNNQWKQVSFRLTTLKQLNEILSQYLEQIFQQSVNDQSHTVVTNNALDPSNPNRGLRVFDNMKSIVVDRDVRDIYMTATQFSQGFNDNVALFSKVAGAEDIEVFIKRQKIIRAENRLSNEFEHRILRLNFENLVMDYDNILSQLYQFLGVNKSQHQKMTVFDPNKSSLNIGLWKAATGDALKNIKLIEKNLPDYCYG